MEEDGQTTRCVREAGEFRLPEPTRGLSGIFRQTVSQSLNPSEATNGLWSPDQHRAVLGSALGCQRGLEREDAAS